jgi:type IV secretory pathway ATPase VirB11/archaellum biosynthesis ATPase
MNDVKTIESVKREAKALARATTVTHSQLLDVLSVQAGYSHWGAYQQAIVQNEKIEAERLGKAIRPIDLIRALIQDMPHVHPGVEGARHLFVSGGTSSGKTTAMRRLATFVPEGVGVTFVGDEGERVDPFPFDRNGHLASEPRPPQSGASLTARVPKSDGGIGVIFCEEITTRNADELLKAIRDPSGPMVLAGIHASEPSEIREIFAHRSALRHQLRDDDRIACLQMRRDPMGRRHVSDIVAV